MRHADQGLLPRHRPESALQRRVDLHGTERFLHVGAVTGFPNRVRRGSSTRHVVIRRPAAAPHLSVVIPVYNEEGILRGSVLELLEKLRRFAPSYEILICENGSRDRTIEIGKEIEANTPRCACCRSGEPNYGKAMKMGILAARGHVRHLRRDRPVRHGLLRPRAGPAGAQRHRPGGRHQVHGGVERRAAAVPPRWAPGSTTGMLRVACRFKGTDTHGLKAFQREALVDTAQRCMLDRDVFASEFVIRAHREGKKVVEIPFAVREKRPPSINLVKRVPHVLKSVARLAMSVRQ